jgi:hypothetical protein
MPPALMPLLRSKIPNTDVLVILELKIVRLSFAKPQPFTHSSTNLIRWPSMTRATYRVWWVGVCRFNWGEGGADISRSPVYCHDRVHIPKRLKVQLYLPNFAILDRNICWELYINIFNDLAYDWILHIM